LAQRLYKCGRVVEPLKALIQKNHEEKTEINLELEKNRHALSSPLFLCFVGHVAILFKIKQFESNQTTIFNMHLSANKDIPEAFIYLAWLETLGHEKAPFYRKKNKKTINFTLNYKSLLKMLYSWIFFISYQLGLSNKSILTEGKVYILFQYLMNSIAYFSITKATQTEEIQKILDTLIHAYFRFVYFLKLNHPDSKLLAKIIEDSKPSFQKYTKQNIDDYFEAYNQEIYGLDTYLASLLESMDVIDYVNRYHASLEIKPDLYKEPFKIAYAFGRRALSINILDLKKIHDKDTRNTKIAESLTFAKRLQDQGMSEETACMHLFESLPKLISDNKVYILNFIKILERKFSNPNVKASLESFVNQSLSEEYPRSYDELFRALIAFWYIFENPETLRFGLGLLAKSYLGGLYSAINPWLIQMGKAFIYSKDVKRYEYFAWFLKIIHVHPLNAKLTPIVKEIKRYEKTNGNDSRILENILNLSMDQKTLCEIANSWFSESGLETLPVYDPKIIKKQNLIKEISQKIALEFNPIFSNLIELNIMAAQGFRVASIKQDYLVLLKNNPLSEKYKDQIFELGSRIAGFTNYRIMVQKLLDDNQGDPREINYPLLFNIERNQAPNANFLIYSKMRFLSERIKCIQSSFEDLKKLINIFIEFNLMKIDPELGVLYKDQVLNQFNQFIKQVNYFSKQALCQADSFVSFIRGLKLDLKNTLSAFEEKYPLSMEEKKDLEEFLFIPEKKPMALTEQKI
ncbi:MAG: hypothetical protein ACKOAD_08160, partial [Gammaproteobacteria bacterium]